MQNNLFDEYTVGTTAILTIGFLLALGITKGCANDRHLDDLKAIHNADVLKAKSTCLATGRAVLECDRAF